MQNIKNIYIYIQSFLVWFLWWLRHGAMDPFEGTHLGECWRTDLRFTHFNLVIPFLTFFILLHSSLRYLGKSTFAQLKLYATAWNWLLSQDRNGVDNMAFMDHGRLEASCFQVWSTFFCCFSGEVEHIVHLIHLNLKSHSMPTCGCDWLPSPRWKNVRLYF